MPGIDNLFPDAPRTVYERNPLREVICQVRYPTILKIEAQPPADFQERLRDRLPILERSASRAAQQIPQELLQAIGAPTAGTGYTFRDEDNVVSVTLLADALTISTKAYARWEVFWDTCEAAFAALSELYRPVFYNRIGLRYRNVITRSSLGLDEIAWSELLSEPVVSELVSSDWEGLVDEAQHQVRCLDHETGDGLFFQHGIVETDDSDETQYIIDFDFYRGGRIEACEVHNLFAIYNRRIGRAFRWAIRDRLHDALGPRAP
ncbi:MULTISPECIES: TIGR04255 family protein [unclassified Novosphingobium]|uniref:TIGR04255 family protein n=1 Tax=unclassified Novosphingobium TaxID=2644732 RepID=UPI000ED9C72B|nr:MULTISPECIES: TIGR04255 family protein [unclassified Novosphingobium]HCF24064.1 hypothetical protein [Novosphingobium sp.]HQV04424.1 TIGR04255 family protein [Novosphingobium sp.]